MSRVDSLFSVSYGNKLDMNKMTRTAKSTGTAFVGRRGSGQGISGLVEPIAGVPPYPAGLMTVALGGSRLLSSFVQQRPFYTAQNVAVLAPLDPEMPLLHRMYYCICIRHNAFRYTAFGREANRTLATISLPSQVPAWVDATTIPTHAGLAASVAPTLPLADPGLWSEFRLGSLFEVKKGKRLTKAARTHGTVRFIGASMKNNGITDYTDVLPAHESGRLTVPYNGNSVGCAFFQDKPFFACDDVNVLDPKEPISMWASQFVAVVLRHGRSRYTYGYKWTKERMTETVIRLPATAEGTPDWEYMESYMRGLPFSSAVNAD